MPLTHYTLIDGNSVGHSAMHGFGGKGKLVAGGQETTAIFGMMQSMHKIMRTRTSTAPVCLWDGHSHRYATFPEYKGNRTVTAEQKTDRERYRSQRQAMFEGLHYLGVKQLVASNMEADDLAAILTREYIAKGDLVTLVSGDKDWIFMVGQGCVWQDHKLDRKVTVQNFAEFTGYHTPKAFAHSKGLQGDSGDNIKPNIGIGEVGAKQLLDVFPCVYSFWATPFDQANTLFLARHGKNLTSKMKALHEDPATRARFEWALSLMDLGHPSIPKPTGVKASRAPVNRQAFESFCMRYGMSSILKGMDDFIKPFTTMEEDFYK